MKKALRSPIAALFLLAVLLALVLLDVLRSGSEVRPRSV